MKTVTINPVTRLEGHGKISIFLNDEGNLENAYFQVPELRGFEKFCEGRPVEELRAIVAAHVQVFLKNFRKGGNDKTAHSSCDALKHKASQATRSRRSSLTERDHVKSRCAMPCSWSTR